MRFTYKILLSLAAAVAFLAFGWWWIAPTLRILSEGNRVEARIAAMLRIRATNADVITGLQATARLALRNGERLECTFDNFRLVSTTLTLPGGEELSALPKEHRFASEDGREVLQRIARGNVDELQRILRRDARLKQPDGIVGLAKTEVALGQFGLPAAPRRFTWDGTGPVAPVAVTSPDMVEPLDRILTTARFGTEADEFRPGAEPRRAVDYNVVREIVLGGESVHIEFAEGARFSETMIVRGGTATPLRDFTMRAEPGAPKLEVRKGGEIVLAAGVPVQRSDFVMFDGGPETEYRPVLSFLSESGPEAAVSDLGKIRGESSAFRLFSPAFAYLAPGHPPMMVSDLAALGATKSVLSWFSSASEAVFSRWVYPTLFWSFGVFFLLLAVLLLSLKIFPGNPDPGP